jgi:hypothetical protein
VIPACADAAKSAAAKAMVDFMASNVMLRKTTKIKRDEMRQRREMVLKW